MATHLGSPQFHSRTIRYFFFLSLYVVSILAPIASSMAFTSAACAPSGASSKYFFRASAVPGGTVYLFCASNLPLPYMDDPLMKYASALLGSAAMALSQATDAPSMLPVLYWVAQMLKYAVPGLGDNSAALLKASIASGFFFSLRYALPSLVSICAAAALALAGSALGSLPFWAKGTAFPNVARASSYFPRFNCAFPSACRYSQRVGLMVESCCSKGSATCQFCACTAGLSWAMSAFSLSAFLLCSIAASLSFLAASVSAAFSLVLEVPVATAPAPSLAFAASLISIRKWSSVPPSLRIGVFFFKTLSPPPLMISISYS